MGRRQHGDTQQIPVVANAVEGVRRATAPIDPLLRRMGALAVALAMCVPVAMALRGGDDRTSLQPQATTVAIGGAAQPAPAVAAAPAAAAAEVPATTSPATDDQVAA
ncbi:MAG: hypothetical protein WCC60_20595, partial [Ilumatobacteraceae bacterium]